jgi:hypothetical protein
MQIAKLSKYINDQWVGFLWTPDLVHGIRRWSARIKRGESVRLEIYRA